MSALKYLGVLILVIGVVILTVPTIIDKPSNTYLLIGVFLIIGGYLGHIFLNRHIQ